MCGILGLVGFEDTDALLDVARQSLPTLAHRGPDDAGVAVYDPRMPAGYLLNDRGDRDAWPRDGAMIRTPHAARVVLGARRLAILDLSAAGHQPMLTPEGRCAIVFNGEIYNYLELRRELESRGHQFRGRSDTEVLLAAYATWGPQCLHRLVGMFAVAILDTKTNRLFLARDGFGMKPLFYKWHGSGIAFASEIPALLCLPGTSRRVLARRLFDYLRYGRTDDDARTLFADIRSLPPAHYIDIALRSPTQVDPIRYWQPSVDETLELSFDDAARRMGELFLESVELHMRSDVPIGTMLSGGTDSSSVAMVMRHLGGTNLDLHTFSYIGEHGAPSEESWIDVVNGASRAVSHKVRLDPKSWWNEIDRVVETQGEPFGSIAVYAQNLLYREAAEQGIKVVLGGQGGDEIVAGYDHHVTARLASLIRDGAWRRAYRLWRRKEAGRGWGGGGIRRALNSMYLALPARAASAISSQRRPPRWISTGWSRRHGVVQRAFRPAGTRVLHGMLRYHLGTNLPILLRYEDRNAMCHSVEGRLPFLTRELAEFVLRLPEDYLVDQNGNGKAVFRRAMRGIVPDAILNRSDKIGFAVPLRSWPGMIPGMDGVLEEAAAVPALDLSELTRLRTMYSTQRILRLQDSFLLWRLVGLVLWKRRFDVTFD